MSQMLPRIIESLIILLTAYAGAVIFLFPGDLREGWRWRIIAAGAAFICAGELLLFCLTRLGVSRAFWGGGIFALLLVCTEKGIKINCVADGAQLSFMDPVDFYMIFGNAIDNAIEEVSKAETDAERQIDIMIFKQKCFVAVQIINPVTKTPKFVGGLPLTTKEDNGYHGYGMKSIRHTVEKYSGNMVAKVENGCFVLKLLIPVP